MAESIKDKVAIIGMGCTAFGELWDKDVDDLMVDATMEALEDAGLELKDIQAVWAGTANSGVNGSSASAPLQLQYIPVTRVENACATGIETIRNAAHALASGVYDLVLALGFEKLKDLGYPGLHPGKLSDKFHPIYPAGGTGPGRYALAATRYFERYGLSPEEGKKTIGKISVKSHYSGARNPKAHLRREITIDQVLRAPMIAWPLGLFDCCGVTDGASAAILCRAEDVGRFAPHRRDDYITIKGMGVSAGPGWGKNKEDYDFTHWPETEKAAEQAYRMAGIKDPRRELDVAEIHDCFSIAELIAMESLGLCEKGKAREELIDNGATIAPQFREEVMRKWGASDEEIERKPGPDEVVVVNNSGGLKSFGHPVGASGGREVYEIYKQIQGKVKEPSRQLKGVRIGLAHNQGGHPGRFVCGVIIVGVPEERL
ncbi:MAG: acetyl-CoA acetyltransferase [Deltaproteobacteria bacterium]|nr:acetyl-CoA acetyltransferase [Deltaproteobacteria bacterium]MBW2138261.1 acetyl-CoA acetyltransferase [Deltaproteobacteria bacterium]